MGSNALRFVQEKGFIPYLDPLPEIEESETDEEWRVRAGYPKSPSIEDGRFEDPNVTQALVRYFQHTEDPEKWLAVFDDGAYVLDVFVWSWADLVALRVYWAPLLSLMVTDDRRVNRANTKRAERGRR